MTFIKYTHDGKAVIQPAALTLSNLDNEDTLEMHTLEKAIVLLKEKMTPVEKVETACGLMRLINSLSADLMCGFDECIDEDEASVMIRSPSPPRLSRMLAFGARI